MAGVSGQLQHLGETRRKDDKKIHINIPVMVKRKNAVVEQVNLLDEFKRFLDSDLPDFCSDFIKMPGNFRFNVAKLNKIEGFPATAREIVRKQKAAGGAGLDVGLDKWAGAAQADRAEEEAICAVEAAFRESPGLLWSGLKKEKLFNVVRRSLGFSGNQAVQANTAQFSQQEITFYKMVGVDVTQLTQDVATLTSHLFPDPAISSLSQRDILSNLTAALRIIKPAYTQLPEEARNKYRDKMIGHVKLTFRTAPHGGTLARDQIQASLTRHLLAYLDRNDEYDIVLFDPSSCSMIHQEVKSWPQNGDLDSPGQWNNLKKGDLQLGKFKDLVSTVIGPTADLSATWKIIGLISLPNVPSRKDLENRGVDVASLKYILTRAELTDPSCAWKKDLQLGTQVCDPEEYKRLLAILIGSHYVSFQNQSYDRTAELEEAVRDTVARVTGPSQAVVGLGGWSGVIDHAPGDAKGLRGKYLGHIW